MKKFLERLIYSNFFHIVEYLDIDPDYLFFSVQAEISRKCLISFEGSLNVEIS